MKIERGAPYVVDTNVAVAANGSADAQGDARCQLSCIEALERLIECGVVVVDEVVDGTGSVRGHLIFEEYRDRLSFGGPSVGNRFLKHVHDHMWGSERACRVRIEEAAEDRGFRELPPNTFDPSDRKFLAAAVVAGADVLNATDSDWAEHRALTDRLGVSVLQLCPRYAVKAGGRQ